MGHMLTRVGLMEMYPTQNACRRALFERSWRATVLGHPARPREAK